MEKAKKARTVQRTAITRTMNLLKEKMEAPDSNRIDILASFELLEEKMRDLVEMTKVVFDLLVGTDASEEQIAAECESADEYKTKFHAIKLRILDAQRTLNSPTKIHEDADIPNEDKFQYLIQAIVPGSRASDLVQSFPPTGENYIKVVDSLKSRFGRDELLVEVYVRELLTLVLQNATSTAEKDTLSALYDKLESYLRALETLGVTTDKCAAMLYPLVESSLPEELLRVWQRTTTAAVSTESKDESKDRLTKLMKFLQSEVENEERITMAVTGFGLNNDKLKRNKPRVTAAKEIPSATNLLVTKISCVFCGNGHTGANCERARKMTLAEKQNALKEKKACYQCLNVGHTRMRCRVTIKCAWCSRRHATVMCPEMTCRESNGGSGSKEESVTSGTEHNLANSTASLGVYLMTLRAKLRNDDEERNVRVIVDTGSQKTYILRSAAKAMGYPVVEKQTITHSLFGGVKSERRDHQVYLIRLSDLSGQYRCNFRATDEEKICDPIPGITQEPWVDELKSMNIELTDLDSQIDEPITVLIGADVAGKLITGKRRELSNGLVALETLLGWTMMGRPPGADARTDSTLMITSMFVREAKITDLWTLDVIGIADPVARKSREEKDDAVRNSLRQNIRFRDDGRYEVQLPWVDDHAPLPENRNLAMKRLINLRSRLQTDGYYDEYDKVLQDWLREGIIERVPKEEARNYAHYLPHRHVIKLHSTTKVRPVFDASAREKDSPSLNQCLEKGPNMIELIPTVLLNFRKNNVGVVSDIKKAFLQIAVRSEDRNFLRFLWWKNGEESEIEMYRHARVVFGVSSSPFILAVVIELHLQRMLQRETGVRGLALSEIILKLMSSFYVDNCVTSVDSVEELRQFVEVSTMLMAEGGFELRGWESSHDASGSAPTPVLGLRWDRADDTLSLNLDAVDFAVDVTENVTKRVILSAAHRIFDPIGFSCPVMLCPKLLMQKSWVSQVDWDTEVQEDVRTEFLRWTEGLMALKQIRIPRRLFGATGARCFSVHTFCDASRDAYAAVVFVRSQNGPNTRVQLAAAKTRVSPVKEVTIPRLELLAATVGARFADSVLKDLQCGDIPKYFWTDSATVLSWIQRESQWNVFVWNRVQEIRKLTKPENWRHIPGTENPADLPSRGCTAQQLLASKWWEGPAWLYRLPEDWPSASFGVSEEEVNAERRTSRTLLKNGAKCGQKSVGLIASVCVADPTGQPAWFERYFSKYSKIVRLVAWVYRFGANAMKPSSVRLGCESNASEVSAAELRLLRLVQQRCFDGVRDPRLTTLGPCVDKDGLMRLQTRIVRRMDSYTFRYPIILDSADRIVRLLIKEKHEKLCHAGIQILMSDIRENYWVTNARRTIRSVINGCVVCKRQVGKRLEVLPTPLPMDRVRDAALFEVCGVDFAGPVFLRGGQKAWICLFTCAVYRAVHLELVTSLSASVFIDGLRRFVARRGRPSIVYSDNGTNFTGAAKLFRSMNWKIIAEYSSVQKIEWRFSPPSAAWWGGFWERMVRMLKQLLKRVLGKACLSYEEMVTSLCDCEATINSRPLTYVSGDPEDLSPLTPAMFMQDIKEIGVPDCDIADRGNLDKRLRYRQKLKDDLRRRFRSEYLGQLAYSYKAGKTVPRIELDDVVLVGADNQKRIDWPLARVVEVIRGRDGHVRVVRLRTSRGALVRPLQRVYPLELSGSERLAVLPRIKAKIVSGEREEPRDPPRRTTVTKSGRISREPARYGSGVTSG